MCRSPKELKTFFEVPYVVDVKVHVLGFNMILVSSPQRDPTSSYPFRGNLGDQVKGRSTKKLKSLTEVPYVAHLKVQVLSFLFSFPQRVPRPSYPFQDKFRISGNVSFSKKLKLIIEVPYVVDVKVLVLSFNMILILSTQSVLTLSYPFRGNLGDQVKGRSPKKLKTLIQVPYVAHLKVEVLSFNKNLIFSPQSVPRPSYPFREKFGRSGKESFTEEAKVFDRGSICSKPESTGSNLQYEPFVFSVAWSLTELSISGNIWEIRENVIHQKR